MINISQENINTGVYLFLVVAGFVTLFGALITYFSRPVKKRKDKKNGFK